jgi:hypothetical protein
MIAMLLLPSLVARAQDAASPTPQAEPKSLQAIVIDVEGKARWRPTADGAWRDAKVNDLLDPGAEVRTGLRSRLTMRVGRNATVLVDSGTAMELPRVAMDGDTLRTTAMVRSGRVDFKVDKVGYANDFQVVTPQTTLAVRGTGFSLSTGPLLGAEVTGARTNVINAIEVRYVASNLTYFMSGGASSNSERPDPVQHAWASTIGPPPVVGLLADRGQLEQQVAQGQAGNAPTNPQQFQQIVAAEANGLGGNGIIAAANQDGASGAIQDAADEVTGNGGNGDFLNQLRNPVLRSELRTLRQDAPGLRADAEGLDTQASVLALAGGVLRSAYEGVETMQPAPDMGSRGYLMSEVIVLGNDLPNDFRQDIGKIEQWAGRAVFSQDPDGTPIEQRPFDSRGIVGALASARAWSASDLGDARRVEADVSSALRGTAPNEGFAIARIADLHDGAFSLWRPERPDAGAPRPDTSPLLLALAMNERVQDRWAALSGDLYASLASSNQGVRTATAQVMASMHAGQFGDVSTGWRQYIAEYRRMAEAEGSPAAQRAMDEVEATATQIGLATEEALLDAKIALERAGEARTLGQRVLFESIGGAQFQRAATIARLSQEAVTGTWVEGGVLEEAGILQNALDIMAAYGRVMDQAAQHGLELPDNLGAIGGGNTGGNGGGNTGGNGGGNTGGNGGGNAGGTGGGNA